MLQWLWGFGGPLRGYSYATLRNSVEGAASGKQALRRTSEQGERIAELERRIERLTLSGMAMWSLLCEKHGFSEADLLAKIEEIDLGDGRADGRVEQPKGRRCGECGRMVSKIHTICIYCDSSLLASDSSST